MPPRKKKDYISDKHKSKGLFDHLRELTEGVDEHYWGDLTGGEKVDFQPYMVNRFLSMNPEWIEMVDELQRFTVGILPKKSVFDLYHEILPKGRVFLRYIKGKGKATIPDALATMLQRYFECSEKEMREHFDLLMRSAQGKSFIVELMQAYGTQEKELKKLRKEIGV
jgi:hypothetical protein